MNIEKIRVSQFEPESTDLAWYNPQTKELRIFTNGEWALVAGGGGGGGGHLLVGTKEDREALTPYNGLEFNQVDEDGIVHRYLYEENEWVLLLNPEAHDSEEVIIKLSAKGGTLDVSTLTAKVTNLETGVEHVVEIDSAGEGIIYIPINDYYKVEFAEVLGYRTPTEIIHKAERYIRQIDAVYLVDAWGTGYVVEASSMPAVPLDGDTTAVDRILACRLDGNPGSYVIDEVHKKYARLDPEDHTKFADGSAWSGTYGSAFRHIGKAYLLVDATYDGEGTKYYISDYIDETENPIILPEEWTGIYKGSVVDGKLVSRPNLTPTRSATIAQFQSYAQMNASYYGIRDYKSWVKMCHLFMAKYGTRDSQSTIGMGMTKADPETNGTYKNQLWATTTGYTATLGDTSGEMTATTVNGYTYSQCKLFGIEAPWGQNWEFLKGIRFNGSTAYVYDANVVGSTVPGDRTFIRHTSLSSTYFNKAVLGPYGDMIPSASATGMDSSHNYCDGSWSANAENLLDVCGSSANGALSGLFSSASHFDFSYSTADNGARLCFYGDISEYELVTGAALAALNS